MTTLAPVDEADTAYEGAQFETPFAEIFAPGQAEPAQASGSNRFEAPFVGEYRVGDEVVGEGSHAVRDLMAELYDREFDELVADLVDEADAHAQMLGLEEDGSNSSDVERSLERWIEPLRLDAEELLDRMSGALETADLETMSDEHVDQLLDQFEPGEPGEAPVFEGFLKKLWRKAKTAVKGAVNLAKKGLAAVGKILPIGAILSKIKALVKPLLRRVLKLALNKLPVAVRPAATLLARRLGLGEVESEGHGEADDAAPATADVRSLQQGFDAEVTSLMLAGTESEAALRVAEANVAALHEGDDTSLSELDRARDVFVDRFARLSDGEDPTPAIQEFVPAILGALRIGIGIIGRPRVVGFLGKLLGRLVAPYVGPQLAQPLSRAIADSGLRLMSLEEPDSATSPRLAAETFAALVEDTVREVAALDSAELDESGVVEEVAFQAFSRSSRNHLPSVVLRGATRQRGTWVAMPRRGPRRYRKYSHTFDVSISPEAAALIGTGGGSTLSTFLRDRLGLNGMVQARVHLFEILPGGRTGLIARAEPTMRAAGVVASQLRGELHPLTQTAAATLLGDPTLGAGEVSEVFDELGPANVGERLYFLEVPSGGRRSAVGSAGSAATRISHCSVKAEGGAGVTVHVFLGEAHAQDVAARLRRNEAIGSIIMSMRQLYAAPKASGRLQPRSRAFSPNDRAAMRTARRWIRLALARQLSALRSEFIQASEQPADGVTLVLRIGGQQGQALARQFSGQRKAGDAESLRHAPASMAVEVKAGHVRV